MASPYSGRQKFLTKGQHASPEITLPALSVNETMNSLRIFVDGRAAATNLPYMQKPALLRLN